MVYVCICLKISIEILSSMQIFQLCYFTSFFFYMKIWWNIQEKSWWCSAFSNAKFESNRTKWNSQNFQVRWKSHPMLALLRNLNYQRPLKSHTTTTAQERLNIRLSLSNAFSGHINVSVFSTKKEHMLICYSAHRMGRQIK